jgi:hypothetical protein
VTPDTVSGTTADVDDADVGYPDAATDGPPIGRLFEAVAERLEGEPSDRARRLGEAYASRLHAVRSEEAGPPGAGSLPQSSRGRG